MSWPGLGPKATYRCTFDPPGEGLEEPAFWSVMIPCYNCGEYLGDAIESVLQQDPGRSKMQIEVIDDHSTTGDIRKLVSGFGGRVGYHRHPVNKGIAGAFNTCLKRAIGRWVHILHADDVALPGLYEAVEDVTRSTVDLAMVFTHAVAIDKTGRWKELMHRPFMEDSGVMQDAFERLLSWNFIINPGAIVRRSVYEEVGGFAPGLSHTADWEMWMRVANHGPVFYIDRPFVGYRVHTGSDTSGSTLTGRTMREYEETVAIGLSHLEGEELTIASARALRPCAIGYGHQCRAPEGEGVRTGIAACPARARSSDISGLLPCRRRSDPLRANRGYEAFRTTQMTEATRARASR